MKRHWLGIAVLMATALLSPGCGDDDDDDDDDLFLSLLNGTYFGNVDDDVVGPGQIEVTITQVGDGFSGTFVSDYPGTVNDNSGTISGSVIGNSISFTLNSADPAVCDFVGSGERISEDRLVGDFEETGSCAEDVQGTFDIER